MCAQSHHWFKKERTRSECLKMDLSVHRLSAFMLSQEIGVLVPSDSDDIIFAFHLRIGECRVVYHSACKQSSSWLRPDYHQQHLSEQSWLVSGP